MYTPMKLSLMNPKQWILVATVALLTGCAGAEDEGAADEGGQAATAGSRWSSPLKVGDYDGDDLTLDVFTLLDRQYVSLGGTVDGCGGAVDVSNGRVSVRRADCSLTLTATSGGIDIEGTTSDGPVRGSLVRRQPKALVGNYGSDDASAEMDITSSADGRFTFSLKVQGKTLASDATAIQQGGDLLTLLTPGLFTRWYTSDAIPECSLSPGRAKGKPYILFVNSGDKTCPVAGRVVARSR
jgi:hypothetical protein